MALFEALGALGGLWALPLLAWLGSRLLPREDRRAAFFYGVAATVFLWPAVTMPWGAPSAARGIGQVAPWAQAAEDIQGQWTPALRAMPDVTFQIQPWLLLQREQLRGLEPPFWNPYSFLGQPFWSNGQSAPLFPLHLLFVLLPLRWGLLLLPWLRLVIAALGTRRLARRLGVGESGAVVAGLAFSLSGMVSGFLLFPMANVLCLVPWIFWAVEGLVDGNDLRRGTAWLASIVALAAVGGHPGTLVHAAFASAIYLGSRIVLARPSRRAEPIRVAGSWIGAWVLGAALAAVQLVPMALHLPDTPRWTAASTGVAQPSGADGPSWLAVLPLALRWVLPGAFGDSAAGTWHGPFFDLSSRAFVGVIPLVLALSAFSGSGAQGSARSEPDRRWTAWAVLAAFFALVVYRAPGLSELVESLPVVGVAQPHRLLFVVILGVSLLAGRGWDRLASVRGADGSGLRRALRCLALPALGVFGGLAVAWSLCSASWREHGLIPLQAGWTAWAVVAVAWLVMAGGGRRAGSYFVGRPAAVLPLLVLLELAVAHSALLPAQPVDDGTADLYPATPAIRFLAAATEEDEGIAGVGSTLRPGTSMAFGLRDLRGDDPAHPQRFDRLYRSFGKVHPPVFHPLTRWPRRELDRLAVRYVIAPPETSRQEVAPGDGPWLLRYQGQDARVFERPGAGAPARWSDPPGRAVKLERPADHVRILRVDGSRETGGTVVVAEAWASGWHGRARVGEEWVRTRVEPDGYLMRVEVPTGSHEVELRYRPPGLLAGALLSVAAGLWLYWSLGPLRRELASAGEGAA